jgi:ATP-dependent exoDNAse (exonuclease V) beta subunit
LAKRQEMERLLYVALTRARHTLVLVFDNALFHTAQGASPKNSQARWLHSAEREENGEIFGTLPKQTQYCAATQEAQREDTTRRELEQKLTLLPEIGVKTKRDSLKRAADYIRKLNPSRVASGRVLPITGADGWKETDPELRPLAVESAATRYGLWWHEFAQRIPWAADANAYAKVFDEHQLRSPDTGRSLREWQLLREHLNGSADFRKKFTGDGVLLHSEMPFLWPGEASKCVEGIVDLAIFDRARKQWLILDWKTNRITAEQTNLLRKQYLPQLAAYWKAITQMTGMSVEVRIYSSATGQFIAYEPDELGSEWERLRKLPLNDLTWEIEAGNPVSDRVRRG